MESSCFSVPTKVGAKVCEGKEEREAGNGYSDSKEDEEECVTLWKLQGILRRLASWKSQIFTLLVGNMVKSRTRNALE